MKQLKFAAALCALGMAAAAPAQNGNPTRMEPDRLVRINDAIAAKAARGGSRPAGASYPDLDAVIAVRTAHAINIGWLRKEAPPSSCPPASLRGDDTANIQAFASFLKANRTRRFPDNGMMRPSLWEPYRAYLIATYPCS